MQQSRIIFVCPSKSWGGLEMNVLRLSVWLKKRGIDVLLYCDDDYELAIQAIKFGIERKQLEHRSKFKDLFGARKLAKSFEKEKADIVLFHVNKNFPLMSLTKIFSKRKFKLLYMQHMHLGGSKKDFLHRQIYKQLDCWIAPLQMFKNRLLEVTTIPKEKIEVIPFGIELDKFLHCKYPQTEAREKLNLPIDKIIVGFIGRIDRFKCQHVLIEAVHKLHQDGIEIDVLFVGDSTRNEEVHYREELDELVEKYNLQEKVHFKPFTDEIEVAFKALDIFCLTTGSETYGMVTIEAMASELVVIGSDQGGTTEIIQHKKNGFLYESLNSTDLAGTIKKVLQYKSLQQSLREQARKDAIAKYSHTVQCDLLQKCFKKYS